jgi:hypothetical protein
LKFLGGNSHVVVLNDRDFVQKPIQLRRARQRAGRRRC